MKTLTLLRHAKSSWTRPGLADHDRPLNERGERDTPLMARRLTDAGIRPSLILSSTATRALSTARILAREIGYPAEFLQRDAGLYLASRQSLIDVISEQDNGFNSIVIVGHNPGLTELADFLVPGITDNIPTCGFFCVSLDADDWNLRAARSIELYRYDFPKNAE
ncbi:MAG: histidine phosphatase family protein [Gammaproteobacteria bacterium]|nr:histidine phosphatase family protein [Gammaproteobacteria bacterium]MDH4315521.1 histidine phosphatase family protein [Gammaproteobacteria bacterium]MDH5214306.1 histidine phosphatase family protein [Gammaproteobacteria bacterium]MDH5501399.1 histidine phosphatase family protein [Gammaproteobacteria bacterium]